MNKKNKVWLILIAVLVSSAFSLMALNGVQANFVQTWYPPIVQMDQEQVNVTISSVNGTLWATVDAVYPMREIYKYGDTFTRFGFNCSVKYNQLDMHYPVPPNTTSLSIKMDGAEVNWVQSNRTYPLHFTNLPEVQWTISPVPSNYTFTIHYEYPIAVIEGELSFLYSMGSRQGLDETSYSTSWMQNSSASMNIQVNFDAANLTAYAVDGFGQLHQLNFTTTLNENGQALQLTVNSSADESAYGVLLTFQEATPTTPEFSSTTILSGALVLCLTAVVAAIAKKSKLAAVS
jgi:hypothetical protein